MNWIKKLEVGIEELILLILIFLAIFDFLEVLPIELDYIKKIISWSALGYLLYKASLTHILFGKKIKSIDLQLILAYFLLIIKNLIGFSKVALAELSHVIESAGPVRQSLAKFLLHIYSNGSLIEIIGLYAGLIWILFLSLKLVKVKLGKKSVIGIVHEENKVTGKHSIIRFFVIYSILLSFFVIVFNLVMEWLTIAVDATFAVLGIFFYMFVWVKHYKKFNTYAFIYNVGNIGEKFYEKFIELFQSKRTIYLGITGMLVLHILTDVANFLIPHTLGIHDALYFSQLPKTGHESIWTLFKLQLVDTNWLPLSLGYLGNLIGIYFLFLGPAYIWKYLYEGHQMSVKRWLKGVFFFCISLMALSPLFSLRQIKDPSYSLLGVDLITQEILVSSKIVLFCVLVGLAFYYLAKIWPVTIRFATFALIQAFFVYYISLYFLDIASYYLVVLKSIPLEHLFLTIHFLAFFVITSLFYCLGGLILIWKVWKKQHV